jgi:predicted DNA-binding WGR domain protein
MPRYELVTDKRNRFWDITLEGRRIDLRFGRRGSNGEVGRESLPTVVAARARYEHLVAEKVAEGYRLVSGDQPATVAKKFRSLRRFEDGRLFREIELEGRTVTQRNGALDARPDAAPPDDEATAYDTEHEARDAFERIAFVYGKRHTLTVSEDIEVQPSDDPELEVGPTVAENAEFEAAIAAAPTVAENPELEAASAAAPGDAEPWAVYTDFLLSEGDPRGEYAVLTRGGATKASDLARLLRLRGQALFGPLAAYARPLALALQHNAAGFPTGVEVHPLEDLTLDEVTRHLLGLPLARFIESLRFGLSSGRQEDTWTTTMQAVIESPRAGALRSLEFSFEPEDSELSWVAFGDFSACWKGLPSLEVMRLRSGAGGVLGDIVAPRLKRFVRESGGLSSDELKSIVDAKWPALEHLELWLGTRSYGAQATGALLAPLLYERPLPKLTSLGLVNGEFPDELLPMLVTSPLLPKLRRLDLSKSTLTRADWLVAHAKAFEHLEVLDLSENLLDDEHCARLKAVLPNVVVDAQRDDGGEDEEDRYAAVGE